MTTDNKKPAMYFASLELENVKSFGGKQTLDLRDSNGAISRWTLILGDNGVGKTTLLKCLAWMLPVKFAEPERFELARKLQAKVDDVQWIKGVLKISDREWEMISNKGSVQEIRRISPLLDSINEDDINAIIRVGPGVTMSIQASFTEGVELNTVPEEKDLLTIGISLERKRDLNEIQDIENTDHLKTAVVEAFNAPNLFAYSAARHMGAKNFDYLEKDPSHNLFSVTGDLFDAEEVLLDLYNASLAEEISFLKKQNEQLKSDYLNSPIDESQDAADDEKPKEKATKYLRKIKEILTQLLPHIDHPECIIINPKNEEDEFSTAKIVEIVTPFGKVGLYDLSLGYQTMLAWVVDLAIRMFWQNPDSQNPLEESAVVIVDEIDLHLHPKWQRTLKDYLTSNFPSTQFICTAHSPFIAQASEDENLCVLHEFKLTSLESEIRIENDPTIVKGWRIGQIVTNLFGVPDTNTEIEELRERRRAIISKAEQTIEDKQELEDINAKLLRIPIAENPETQKVINQILTTAEALKREGKIK